MPLLRCRKRRAQPGAEDEASSAGASPEPQTQRRRTQAHGDENESFAGDYGSTQYSSNEALATKLVRLALACEYGRRPIRRQDINEKVLGSSSGRGRIFNNVFTQAQFHLRSVFGMEMVGLPAREKVTLQQKRAAQRKESQNQTKTTSAWILINVLPPQFRDPDILAPPAAPTSDAEAQYVAISTILVSLVELSHGTLSDTKMDRFLRKLLIDDRTPIPAYEKIEQLMKRLEKDGYLYKVKESTGTGEEDVYYVVGPRGKVEIGVEGVRGLVRFVMPPKDDAEEEELDKKILRSLGISDGPATEIRETGEARNRSKKQRRAAPQQNSEDDDEDEDDEDEDDEDD